MAITHYTSVDFAARPVTQPVHIVQGDQTLPEIVVTLYENGSPYEIPDDAIISIRMDKGDGTYVYNSAASYDQGASTATIVVTQQMASVYGKKTAVIEISEDGNIAASGYLTIFIDKNPVQESMIESTDEYTTIQTMAANSTSSATAAAASAAAASDSATAAAASESAAATSESNAATSETNAASSATAAASSASAASDSAEASEEYAQESEAWAIGTKDGTAVASTDDQYENNSKYYAEQAADSATAAASSAASIDIATTSHTGVVKPDGSTISVTADGTISADGITGVLPVANGGTGAATAAAAAVSLEVLNDAVPGLDTSITDLDLLLTPGFYYVSSDNTANIPEGTNGLVWVFQWHSEAAGYVQIYRRIGTGGTNDNNIYHRRGASGTWTNWSVIRGDFLNSSNSNPKPFTGRVMIDRDDSFGFMVRNTSVTKGTAPSATKYWGVSFMEDGGTSNPNRLGLLETTLTTNNTVSTYIRAYKPESGSTTAGTISVSCDSSGNVSTAAPTPASGDSSTKIATTAFVNPLANYVSGNTVNLSGSIYAGHVTGGGATANFFIPLPKGLGAISSATFSVDTSWGIRHADGGYIAYGVTLASLGTVTLSVKTTGIYVTVTASASFGFTNNCPVAVYAGTATLKLT